VDAQQRLVQIHVGQRESQRFTDPQRRTVEQQKKNAERGRIQSSAWHLKARVRGIEQTLQLCVRKDVRNKTIRNLRHALRQRRMINIAVSDGESMKAAQCFMLAQPETGRRTVACDKGLDRFGRNLRELLAFLTSAEGSKCAGLGGKALRPL